MYIQRRKSVEGMFISDFTKTFATMEVFGGDGEICFENTEQRGLELNGIPKPTWYSLRMVRLISRS